MNPQMCEANMNIMYNTDTWASSLMLGNAAKEATFVQSIGDRAQLGLAITEIVKIQFSFLPPAPLLKSKTNPFSHKLSS